MIEFKPKVKNKYNKLTSEYIKNSKDLIEKGEIGSSLNFSKVSEVKEGFSEAVLSLKVTKTSSVKNKIISNRNRNYNNIIIKIESNVRNEK